MSALVGALALRLLLAAPPEEAPAGALLAAAQAALLEGQGHFREGRYREGIAAYERAYAAFPDPRTLFTLAAAYERLDQACAEAPAAWTRFLAACPACEDRAAGQARQAALLQRCPVRLALGSNPSGASVSLDGRPVGTTPLDLEVPPGSHVVEASLPDHLAARQVVEVAPATPERVMLQLVPAPAGPPEAGAEPDRTWAWVALGAAAAGAATGGFFLVDMQSHVERFEGAASRSEALAAREDADRAALLGQVGLGVAVSGLVSAWLLWPE